MTYFSIGIQWQHIILHSATREAGKINSTSKTRIVLGGDWCPSKSLNEFVIISGHVGILQRRTTNMFLSYGGLASNYLPNKHIYKLTSLPTFSTIFRPSLWRRLDPTDELANYVFHGRTLSSIRVIQLPFQLAIYQRHPRSGLVRCQNSECLFRDHLNSSCQWNTTLFL